MQRQTSGTNAGMDSCRTVSRLQRRWQEKAGGPGGGPGLAQTGLVL